MEKKGKGREEERQRERGAGAGDREVGQGRREGRERRGKTELLVESFLIIDQGQGRTQPLPIQHRVPLQRAPCIQMAWFVIIV